MIKDAKEFLPEFTLVEEIKLPTKPTKKNTPNAPQTHEETEMIEDEVSHEDI